MANHRFYIVDVFAEKKYAGNQLAVFVDRGDLSDAEMQDLAREMHFSETTFVVPERQPDGGYAVRIFTPATELSFAGHPTLGTAFVIRNEIIRTADPVVLLNEKVGQIPVTFRGDIVWMHQKPPTFGAPLDAQVCAATLGVPPEGIDDRFPIQVVSTGLPFVIAPLKSLAAVQRAKPNWDKYVVSNRAETPRAILLFSPETLDTANQLHARVFVDEVGVPEDPATGSANGCLAGYLVKYRYFAKPQIDVRVEQGYEIDRPSLLFLQAQDQGQAIDVHVGGRVVMVAKGEFIQAP
ncbi:MAG: PhzF family phenazine biosynthesis protein [Chloroflexi bacterium]|nr:PhzF family phenazine biosynthesis protein [Chloroflexota bacterium]